VLGDCVNLGKRLETANKFFDTNILINQRAAELIQGEFLCRVIGRICVAGREKPEDVYVPMVRHEDATAMQKALADLSKQLVTAFLAQEFADCLRITDSMDKCFGGTRIGELYRRVASTDGQSNAPEFPGYITLTET
jgi:hypothetical protein